MKEELIDQIQADKFKDIEKKANKRGAIIAVSITTPIFIGLGIYFDMTSIALFATLPSLILKEIFAETIRKRLTKRYNDEP